MTSRPQPPWPPETLKRMTGIAAAGCLLALIGVVLFAMYSDVRPGWAATMFLLLTLAAFFNFRHFWRLRAGRHWSQQQRTPGPSA